MSTVDDVQLFTVNLAGVAPAEGRIVNLTYPESVEYEEMIDINASIRNIGGQSGRFRMRLSVDGVVTAKGVEMILAGGETTPDKIYPFRAPASGTGIDIILECIRKT